MHFYYLHYKLSSAKFRLKCKKLRHITLFVSLTSIQMHTNPEEKMHFVPSVLETGYSLITESTYKRQGI